MPIRRSSDQGSETLEEFYIQFSKTGTSQYADVAKKMLTLIEMINQTFKETQLWGLTSHTRLIIQSEDSSESKWFVIIENVGTDDFYFSYLMPVDKRPWEGARVQGQAESIREARSFMLIAMKESEGWQGNIELEKLMREIE